MVQLDYSQTIERLKQANNILILPSSPPDGDSLGSALALYLVFQKLGKKATVVSNNPIPDAYKFLPDSQSIESTYEFSNDFIVTVDVSETGFKDLQYEVKDHKVNIIITPEHGEIHPDKLVIDQHGSKFDLIITVDTADYSQLGKVYSSNKALFEKVPVINIDHHPSNKQFGVINLVNEDLASTTMILTEMLKAYDPSLIDADVATLLLAGIITDTGSFQNANTTPESFDVAAMLIGYGARQQEIIRHIYKTKELHVLRLWGRVLSQIQTDYEHKIVWSQVSQEDFNETDSKETDIGDIIDELLTNAPEAEVVFLFKELPEGGTQISIRTTTDDINSSDLAANFGGGGHVRAAGARIMDGNFTGNIQSVLDYTRSMQANRLGLIAQSEPALPEPEATETPVVEPILEAVEAPSIPSEHLLDLQEPTPVQPEVMQAPIVDAITPPAEPEVVAAPIKPTPIPAPEFAPAAAEQLFTQPEPTMTPQVESKIMETPTTEPVIEATEAPVAPEVAPAPAEQLFTQPEPVMQSETVQAEAPLTPVAPINQDPQIYSEGVSEPAVQEAISTEDFFHLGNNTGLDDGPAEQPQASFSDTSDLDDYLGNALNDDTPPQV